MITRREFVATLSAAPLLAKDSPPKVAITMDDFNWRIIPASAEPNKAILGALAKRNLRAALFIIADNVEDPAGQKLARAWCDAGHIIGNHTYSHPAITTVSAKEFIGNIARAETILQDLPTYRKLFRFPALKEGETRAKRDAVRTWLAQHGYRIGHVTIDTSDWYYDQRLRAKLKEDPKFDVQRYRDVYLEHMWDCATK